MQLSDLKNILKGEVVNDAKDLQEHSRDASIFEVVPTAVVYPEDVKDLQNLVVGVSEARKAGEDVSITARAAGTCMSGGSLTDSISVDFVKHFDRIGEVSDLGTIDVQPGVYFRDLEKKLSEKGLMFPPFPASKNLCTIGGMVANNAAGEKTLSYGQTERYVTGLDVVLSDGKSYHLQKLNKTELAVKKAQTDFEGEFYKKTFELIDKNYDLIQKAKPKTSKNSSGYYLWDVYNRETGEFDLTKLFVGSQGTLGFISNITLATKPKKPFTRFAVVFLPDLEKLVPIVENVLQYEPEAFECYDDHTFELAVQSMTFELKVLYDAWKPILQMIESHMPKLILLIELASENETEVEEKFAHLISDITKFNVPLRVTSSTIEGEKYWHIRHESFNLLRHNGGGKQSAPFIDDIIVRPQVLKEFMPELEAILLRYEDKMMYTIAGHIGDGNFHIIPLIDFSNQATRDALPQIMDDVFGLVLRYGGSTAAEHNDGLVRSQYLCKQFGRPVCDLFAEVKNIFDPLNIFNPRKKVNVDMDFVRNHIKKTNVHPW